MSLTKATYSMISGAVTNVLDFGADPTGVADSASAFQAALTHMASISQGADYGEAMYIPAGTYKINTPLTVGTGLAHIKIVGDGMWSTRLNGATGQAIFNVNPMTFAAVVDVGFFGGYKAFVAQTANTDQSMFTFERCAFYQQENISVDFLPGTNSTDLVFNRCLFTGNQIFVSTWTDYTKIIDCWINADATNARCFRAYGAEMLLQGNTGVSTSTDVNNVWVYSEGPNIKLLNNRFSSDGGGHRVVLQYKATPSTSNFVYVEDNFIGQNNIGSNADFIFDELPEFVTFRNNRYYTSYGLVMVKSNSGLAYFKRGTFYNENGFNGYWTGTGCNIANTLSFEAERANEQNLRIYPTMSDVAFQQPAQTYAQYNNDAVNMTRSTGTYPYCGGFTALKFTATAGNASVSYYRSAADINPYLTNNQVYTLVCDFYVDGVGTANLILDMYDSRINVVLTQGLNVINLPFTVNDVGFYGLLMAINGMSTGIDVYWGRIRILRGRYQINTPNTIIQDVSSVTPVNSAAVSDMWYYTNPNSGGFLGQICTATGTPATWKTFGAIS